jgi:hypothetical protein
MLLLQGLLMDWSSALLVGLQGVVVSRLQKIPGRDTLLLPVAKLSVQQPR